MRFLYSIVKDSSADLGFNFKIVQNQPTIKGQLISKRPFGVAKTTKKSTKILVRNSALAS